MKPTDTGLTKADTVALWHAVQAQSDLFRATLDLHRKEGGFTSEQIEGERLRLLHSKRALRKVNAIRKALAGIEAESQGRVGNNQHTKEGKENFPGPKPSGQTRDLVAKATGFGKGKTRAKLQVEHKPAGGAGS